MAVCDVQSVNQATLSFEDAFIIPEHDSCFESFLSPTSPDQVFPSMVFNSSIHNQEVPVPDNEVHLLFQSISEVTDSVIAEPGDEIHQAVQDIPDQVVPVETPTNENIHQKAISTSRVKTHQFSRQLSTLLLEFPLDDDSKVNAITTAVRKTELLEKLKQKLKVSSALKKKTGRKLTPYITRKLVWDFWHACSTTSTIANRPALLKVTSKPKVQEDLPFNDSVKLTRNKRNREMYQNLWKITTKRFIELYCQYTLENQNNIASYGTFIALKPF